MAADDFLNSFRTKVVPRPVQNTAPSLVVNKSIGREIYQAFDAKDKISRLDIRCGATGNYMAHAVAYSYLLNLSYNRKTYSEIFITVSGLTVLVKGRNLRPVIEAIRMHKCEFIQEFDASEFDAPTQLNEPYIDSIAVDLIKQKSS